VISGSDRAKRDRYWNPGGSESRKEAADEAHGECPDDPDDGDRSGHREMKRESEWARGQTVEKDPGEGRPE